MKAFDKFLVVVLLSVSAAAVCVAWTCYRENARLRAVLLNPGERAQLEAQLDKDRARIQKLRDALAALRETANLRVDGSDAAESEAASAAGGAADPQADAAALRSPAYEKWQGVVMLGQDSIRYAALIRKLGLSQDQAAQFKNLLVEKQQAVMDAMSAAREQGLQDPQAYRQALQDAAATVDAQIQGMLGASDFSQYQQYEQSLPERNLVSQLQQALSATATPLTDKQAGQLIQMAQQASGSQPQNLRLVLNPAFVLPVNPQVIALSQSVLSQPQEQALQQIQLEQQARRQMALLMQAGQQRKTGGR